MKGIAYWELFAEEKLADFMISDKNKTTIFFMTNGYLNKEFQCIHN